ncbi:MAG: VOC family protein [Methylococcaceae bacterium]|nr:VOC family protein [Methylococcaceae bacterium]
MNIEKLAHIGVRVMEFPRSIQFYQRLGFELIREHYEEKVVVLRHPAGVEVNLIGNGTQGECNMLMDLSVKYPGYTHYALRVASVREALETINELGIAVTEGPVTFGDGSTSIFIRDPDGNVIELSQASAKE